MLSDADRLTYTSPSWLPGRLDELPEYSRNNPNP